jgi:hypothetical protein
MLKISVVPVTILHKLVVKVGELGDVATGLIEFNLNLLGVDSGKLGKAENFLNQIVNHCG